jgi:hypothetical protein
MSFETLNLIPLSDAEASFETLQEMREEFYTFQEIGLESLFNHFTEKHDEV